MNVKKLTGRLRTSNGGLPIVFLFCDRGYTKEIGVINEMFVPRRNDIVDCIVHILEGVFRMNFFELGDNVYFGRILDHCVVAQLRL